MKVEGGTLRLGEAYEGWVRYMKVVLWISRLSEGYKCWVSDIQI